MGEHEASEMGGVVGGFLAVAAAVVSNTGTNVQKASHNRNDKLPEEDKSPYFSRKSWWIGFSLTIVGSVLDFVALALASQAMVAALGGGSTLICNVLVATLYNKEKTEKTDYIGVVFIIAGCVLFAVFAESKEDHTNSEYEAKFFKSYFLIYLAGQSVVILGLLATISHSYFANLRRDWYSSLFLPTDHKIAILERKVANLKGDLDIIKQLERQRNPTEYDSLIRKMSAPEDEVVDDGTMGQRRRDKYIYAMTAGSVGALSVLFGGVVGSMLFQNGAAAAFSSWFFYFALVCMVASLVIQTHLQSRALELGDATAVFPVFEAFWISFGVVSGLIYYNEGASWGSDFKQASGMLPMMVGTLFLFMHDSNTRDELERVTGLPADSFSLNRITMTRLTDIEDFNSSASEPLRWTEAEEGNRASDAEKNYEKFNDETSPLF